VREHCEKKLGEIIKKREKFICHDELETVSAFGFLLVSVLSDIIMSAA